MFNLTRGWGMPPNISAHGAGIDLLINVLHVFMILLFVGWGIFLVYCLIKFRAREGHRSHGEVKHFKLPTYLEVAVAIFEIALLVFVSYPIWKRVKNDIPAEKDAFVVRVVAEQFAWQVHYPGPDGKFGKTRPDLVDDQDNILGLDLENDPNAKDDIVVRNQLHVPVDRPVVVHLNSKDVIHSFFIPVLRVKQDVIPGMEIPLWFEAKQTGEFDIACAQLCGVGHTTMRGAITIETAEAVENWLKQKQEELLG